jgi:hypothetical protein
MSRHLVSLAAGHSLRFAMAPQASGWIECRFHCYMEPGCANGGRSRCRRRHDVVMVPPELGIPVIGGSAAGGERKQARIERRS